MCNLSIYNFKVQVYNINTTKGVLRCNMPFKDD